MPRRAGRHFLQIPGPTNVPDRVLRAIDSPTIDHRGPEFGELGKTVLAGMKRVFKSTQGEVVIYPASGTGAWEAALVNTLSPGDRVLMAETGHFATLWQKMAARLGLVVEFLGTDWRHGADPEAIGKRLRADAAKEIKALCVVHNETSTGVTSRISEVRKAIDASAHPALFMVDTISSLASVDYRHDEWGVDVTVAGSQKGLMLPPGLSFNCISAKALATAKSARLPRSYWSWEEMIANGKSGYFPYTPATNLLYGLREALTMLLDEEGLDAVFSRHLRHAEATRRAVRAWGLEVLALDPREYSPSLTASARSAGCRRASARRPSGRSRRRAAVSTPCSRAAARPGTRRRSSRSPAGSPTLRTRTSSGARLRPPTWTRRGSSPRRTAGASRWSRTGRADISA